MIKVLFPLQVSAYAQQSRESSKNEQAALNERMQEYEKHVNQDCRQSLNDSHGSPNEDIIQPFPRSSHKEIKAVMESASEGKVFNVIFLSSLSTICLSFFVAFISIPLKLLLIFI